MSHAAGNGETHSVYRHAVSTYTVLLRSDESPRARALEYEAEDEPSISDVIVVDGLPVLVDDVRGEVLDCRRLWLFRLVDLGGAPASPGAVLTEQRHYGDVETLVLEGPHRFRVLAVESRWPEGYDGAFVVERLTR